MTNILFSLNEQNFEGERSTGPVLHIKREMGPWGTRIVAQGNAEGLTQLSKHVGQYDVVGLATSIQALTKHVDDLPDTNAIKNLTLSQDLFDPELRDIDVLKKFPNLENLTWLSAAPKQKIADVAPHLRFLKIMKVGKSTLQGLENIEGLNLMSGPDALEKCPSAGLKTLFLGGFAEGKGALLAPFEMLKTVFTTARKSDLSFDFLHTLPNLANFAFDGPRVQNWGSLPPSLQVCSIEQTNGSQAIAAHLGKAKVLALGYDPQSWDDDGFYRGDLLVEGDPFRTIEGPIFMKDID